MAKKQPEEIKVLKPGNLDTERDLRGTCQICGCQVEAKRKICQIIRGPKEASTLALGLECPTIGCTNWIVMGAYDG